MRPLGHGYRFEARVVVWEASGVLSVPGSALFRCAQSGCTFVVERGRARCCELVAGHRSASHVEIVQGLAPGEYVILDPTDRSPTGFG